MKIVHAGDLHVWRYGLPLHDVLAFKRWLGGMNLLLRRAAKFPKEYRQLGLEAIEDQQPDMVVFTGDFSQASQTKEYRECAQLFEPLYEALGDRLIGIPGNHDAYTPAAQKRGLLQKELPWVRTDPVTRMDVTETLTVVTVNHSKPYRLRSNGVVLPETHHALQEMLSDCQKEERTVLLAGHYPYATPAEYPETPHHQLQGEGLLIQLIREMPPAVYLHGHKHVRWAIQPEITPDTVCLNCGSLGMKHDDVVKQAGFLSWDQHDDGSIHHLTAHHLSDPGGWRSTPLEIQPVSG